MIWSRGDGIGIWNLRFQNNFISLGVPFSTLASQEGRAIRYIFLLQKSNKKDAATITHTLLIKPF